MEETKDEQGKNDLDELERGERRVGRKRVSPAVGLQVVLETDPSAGGRSRNPPVYIITTI